MCFGGAARVACVAGRETGKSAFTPGRIDCLRATAERGVRFRFVCVRLLPRREKRGSMLRFRWIRDLVLIVRFVLSIQSRRGALPPQPFRLLTELGARCWLRPLLHALSFS